MSSFVLWLVLAGGGLPSDPPPIPAPLHEVRLVADKDISLHCAAFFPNGKTVVFGGGGPLGPGRLLFWDVPSGKVLHTRTDHKFAIHSIAISSDGKRVVTGGGAGEVIVWGADGKVIATLDGMTESTSAVAFSPDSNWLAHTGADLIVRDTAKFKTVPRGQKAAAFGPSVAFSPNGKWLVGARATGEIRFLSVPEWKEKVYTTKVAEQEYYRPKYSPDGKTLVIHTLVQKRDKDRTHVHTVEVWSVSGSDLGEKQFEVPGHHLGTAFTPDGKYLLLGEVELERQNRVRVWDVKAGREVTSWVVSGSLVRDLAVSPDGSLLVSCTDDNIGKVWDLKKILKDK